MAQSLESPSSFNKALLARTAGGTFDGAHYELKKLRDQWFSRQVHYVRTVDYIGYDKESGIYIFDRFGFYQGQLLNTTNLILLRRTSINSKPMLKITR